MATKATAALADAPRPLMLMATNEYISTVNLAIIAARPWLIPLFLGPSRTTVFIPPHKVIFTVVVMGGSTRALLTSLGLVLSPEENARERIKARDDLAREAEMGERERREEIDLREARDSMVDQTLIEVATAVPWRVRCRRCLRRAAQMLRHLDSTVLRPLFIGRAEEYVHPRMCTHASLHWPCGGVCAPTHVHARMHTTLVMRGLFITNVVHGLCHGCFFRVGRGWATVISHKSL